MVLCAFATIGLQELRGAALPPRKRAACACSANSKRASRVVGNAKHPGEREQMGYELLSRFSPCPLRLSGEYMPLTFTVGDSGNPCAELPAAACALHADRRGAQAGGPRTVGPRPPGFPPRAGRAVPVTVRSPSEPSLVPLAPAFSFTLASIGSWTSRTRPSLRAPFLIHHTWLPLGHGIYTMSWNSTSHGKQVLLQC